MYDYCYIIIGEVVGQVFCLVGQYGSFDGEEVVWCQVCIINLGNCRDIVVVVCYGQGEVCKVLVEVFLCFYFYYWFGVVGKVGCVIVGNGDFKVVFIKIVYGIFDIVGYSSCFQFEFIFCCKLVGDWFCNIGVKQGCQVEGLFDGVIWVCNSIGV